MALPKVIPSTPARAVAIVMGHLGVTARLLDEYSAWFVQNGCTTVALASAPWKFATHGSLKPSARQALSLAATHLRETSHQNSGGTSNHNQTPLILYSMSNGGCFLLYEMEQLLLQEDDNGEEDKQEDSSDTASGKASSLSKEDRALLRGALKTGCQIFDSCPCYLRTAWNAGPSNGFPFPGWPVWGRQVYTTLATASLSVWLLPKYQWPTQFWKHWQNSTLCPHQLYLYTTADVASDATAVDELIQHRRRQSSINNIQVHRWDDSGHCRLHKDHPQEYQAALTQMIDQAVQRTN